jgi:signal transduction histidine kinase
VEHDGSNERRRTLKYFKNPENLRYSLTTLVPIMVFLTSLLSAAMALNTSQHPRTYTIVITAGIALFSALCTFVVVLAITQPLKHLVRQAEQFLRFEKSRKEGGQMLEVYQLIERLMDIVKKNRSNAGEEDRGILEGMERLDYIIPLGYMSLMVAHEVRNPLNTITGMSELLMERSGDETQKRYLRSILDAAQKIDRFTGELFAFTDEELVVEEFDISDGIEEALAGLKTDFTEVQCEYGDRRPIPYQGDSMKIQQAIYNILKNAFEFERNGGFVRVEAISSDDLITITIHNQSSRIDEADRPSLFRPFFSKKKGGRGLGLFISMRNISLHKGSIKVESGDTGTMFIVNLPRTLEVKGRGDN